LTNEIVIGIADFKAGCEGCRLTTIGLGSCIGIVLFDRKKPIAALGHFMLPDSKGARKSQVLKPAKYGDTCIDLLIEEMKKLGCSKKDLGAKAAGGASMFKRTGGTSPIMDISTRNIESLKSNLKRVGIPLVAEDTGGGKGRTITFDVNSKKLTIKIVDPGMKGSDKYRITNI
jgi:chemotaxis protein CheD